MPCMLVNFIRIRKQQVIFRIMHYVQLQLTVQSFKQKSSTYPFRKQTILGIWHLLRERCEDFQYICHENYNVSHKYCKSNLMSQNNKANKQVHLLDRTFNESAFFCFHFQLLLEVTNELGTPLVISIRCLAMIGESVSSDLTVLLHELVCNSFVCWRRLLCCPLSVWL